MDWAAIFGHEVGPKERGKGELFIETGCTDVPSGMKAQWRWSQGPLMLGRSVSSSSSSSSSDDGDDDDDDDKDGVECSGQSSVCHGNVCVFAFSR
jgi:hypothetical protein